MPRELCGRQATSAQQPALIKLIRFNQKRWGVSDKQCEQYLSCVQAYQPAGLLGRAAAEVHPIKCLSHTTGFSLLHHAVFNQVCCHAKFTQCSAAHPSSVFLTFM